MGTDRRAGAASGVDTNVVDRLQVTRPRRGPNPSSGYVEDTGICAPENRRSVWSSLGRIRFDAIDAALPDGSPAGGCWAAAAPGESPATGVAMAAEERGQRGLTRRGHPMRADVAAIDEATVG